MKLPEKKEGFIVIDTDDGTFYCYNDFYEDYMEVNLDKISAKDTLEHVRENALVPEDIKIVKVVMFLFDEKS